MQGRHAVVRFCADGGFVSQKQLHYIPVTKNRCRDQRSGSVYGLCIDLCFVAIERADSPTAGYAPPATALPRTPLSPKPVTEINELFPSTPFPSPSVLLKSKEPTRLPQVMQRQK